jgi:hypothetical protein
VIFDIDDDGDLDMITNDFGSVPQVLVSNLAEKRGGDLRFIHVKLTGSRSNRDALGAKVVGTAGRRQWTQIQDGKSGYLSQSRMPLYFGLGDAAAIDRIDVTWPGGAVSTLRDGLSINRLIEITEPR